MEPTAAASIVRHADRPIGARTMMTGLDALSKAIDSLDEARATLTRQLEPVLRPALTITQGERLRAVNPEDDAPAIETLFRLVDQVEAITADTLDHVSRLALS